MKKFILISILIFMVGVGVGTLSYISFSTLTTEAPYRTTMSTVASTTSTAIPATAVEEPIIAASAEDEVEELDRTNNFLLLSTSNYVLLALQEGDYETVASYVHPEKGVTFTPYSTVNPDIDLCFTSSQVAAFGEDVSTYIWGVWDGLGDPISLTVAEYLDTFALSQDFTQAPNIGINTTQGSGNSIENVSAIFSQGRYVEYYYPQIDVELMGLDWCALKLVFEVYNNQWYLVGVIHSQWTV